MMSPMMTVKAAASKYKGVQVQTSSPANLVVMLFDGILRFTSEAEVAIDVDDRARLGDRIGRVLAIVDHLMATLDPTHAPELSDNLMALYGFCKRRLHQANLKRDKGALADVKIAIRPLREGFAAISK